MHVPDRALLLVIGIAHAEIAGDGPGIHLPGMAIHGVAHGGHVQGMHFPPVHVVTAFHEHGLVRHQIAPKSPTLDHLGIVADQDETGAAASSLHQRIGGQRRRQSDEADLGQIHAFERIDGGIDAATQLVVSRQRLGGGQDAAALPVQDDCVGVRTAGVDSKH